MTRRPPMRKTRFTSGGGWRCGSERLGDGADISIPARHLRAQLLPAAATELVILRLAILLRVSPLGGQPPFALEAMERGVQRPFLDEQLLVSDRVDPLGDGVAVTRPPGDGLENQ